MRISQYQHGTYSVIKADDNFWHVLSIFIFHLSAGKFVVSISHIWCCEWNAIPLTAPNVLNRNHDQAFCYKLFIQSLLILVTLTQSMNSHAIDLIFKEYSEYSLKIRSIAWL